MPSILSGSKFSKRKLVIVGRKEEKERPKTCIPYEKKEKEKVTETETEAEAESPVISSSNRRKDFDW